MFHWSMTVPITVPETIMEVEQFCPWKATGSKQVSYSFHAWRGWRGWRPSQAFAAIATVQLSDLNHMPSKYFRQAKHGKALEFSFFLSLFTSAWRPANSPRTWDGSLDEEKGRRAGGTWESLESLGESSGESPGKANRNSVGESLVLVIYMLLMKNTRGQTKFILWLTGGSNEWLCHMLFTVFG